MASALNTINALHAEEGAQHDTLKDANKGHRTAEHVENIMTDEARPAISDGTRKPLADMEEPALDGGLRAWLQVAGSFLIFSNIWGFTFSFGAFSAFYEITYLPSTSASTVAWIGTSSNFLLIFGGILSGPLFDLGYFRTMLLAGAFIETLSIFLLSLSTKYYQILLTQGILVGLGNSLLYMPGLALIGRSFNKHRSAAMAVATCGAPIGGIIFTLVFQQLIEQLSFGNTVRICGYIVLICYLISFPLLLWGVHNVGSLGQGEKRKLFDGKAFLELPFVLYTASNFMVFFGYLVPFFFMSAYGQIALGMSSSAANATIMITQATSIIGRLAAGYSAARIGNMIQWAICALGSGVLCIGWIGIHSSGTFYLLVALYGFFSGPLISLPPSAFATVCPDPKVFGTRLGMASALGAFASLIGSPIAGALTGSAAGSANFIGLQLFAGICKKQLV
ncbi:hypothetical protein PFICI_02458 [Pestalotiopsis fici W106-1]|uniref:Major facilitator superfamily (MFS) profile domain-containing protein n=1 Tax=Pestalotiopsis fici (strain W106-1 / CGMCC3.15140) TaxID=1229662 RepID=W3XEA4_PESFW|nr:uncharacterized protein PFICI_02458 [Pestalotiopsis fici W106-1]ETS84433.1 hypothetical protein PFICI_02458 [Pestalotiopsis fici W106-1]